MFFVSIAVNCTRFSEISTMPFIRGNARHAGRPPKCKVQISADNRGIKTKRILFLRGRRCNFWKVKAPFPAKLPMRCDSLRTVKAVQAPPHTVPLRRLQNRRQIPLKRHHIALTSNGMQLLECQGSSSSHTVNAMLSQSSTEHLL